MKVRIDIVTHYTSQIDKEIFGLKIPPVVFGINFSCSIEKQSLAKSWYVPLSAVTVEENEILEQKLLCILYYLIPHKIFGFNDIKKVYWDCVKVFEMIAEEKILKEFDPENFYEIGYGSLVIENDDYEDDNCFFFDVEYNFGSFSMPNECGISSKNSGKLYLNPDEYFRLKMDLLKKLGDLCAATKSDQVVSKNLDFKIKHIPEKVLEI